MPETEGTASDSTTSGFDIHAMYAGLQESGEIEKPAETDPPAKEETKPDAVAAEENDAKDEVTTEEDQEDEDDLDLPALDEKILAALGDNAEAKDLWKRQWKGINKSASKLKEAETRFRTESEGYETFRELERGLMDARKAVPTLQVLVDHLKSKGLNVELVVPGQTHTAKTEATAIEFGEDGLTKGGDKALFEAAVTQAVSKATEEAKRSVLAELGIAPAEIKAFMESQKATQAKATADKEFDDYVSGVTPRIAAKAAKTLLWDGVDKAMVGQAAREYPELIKTDAMLALKKTFPDQWAKVNKGEAKTATSMVKSTVTVEKQLPKDPTQISIHEIYEQATRAS